ncbi:MAG: hypothetical protein ACJ77K_17640 [Bacteroidia bacterium]
MEKTNEEKNSTARYMKGKWICKDVNTNVTIEITDREITVAGTVNRATVNATFRNNSWWVGDYLCFTSDQRFYIHYATEQKLAFGELKQPGIIGAIKWGLIFTRIEQ